MNWIARNTTQREKCMMNSKLHLKDYSELAALHYDKCGGCGCNASIMDYHTRMH